MMIHALKLRQTDGEKLHILDRRLQVLHCADAHLSRSLSQTFHRILVSEKVLAATLPVNAIADIPGRGALSALLANAPDDLRDSVPSLSLANEAPEMIGSDLMLLTFEDLLEAGNEYERMALEMAAITDTGNSHHGLIAALARLDAFVEKIGRGNNADTALGRAKARLEALKTERAAAKAALEQAAKLAVPLHEYRQRVEQYRRRRNAADEARCASVVERVTRLQQQRNLLEQQIAEERGKPCLASEQAAAIQRAENLFETARMQVERTRQELRLLCEELDGLQETPSGDTEKPLANPELLEELQRKLQGGQGRVTEFNARLDEVNNQIAALDGHIAETQQQLTGLPDFSRIAPNPIDWLNQLARSFKTAVNMRDGEEETRDAMRAEIAELRVEIAGDAAIFESSANFAEALIVHQGKKKQWESRSTQVEEQVRHNRSLRDELADTILGQFVLSLGCILFLLLLLGAYLGSQKTPILYPCGFLFAATLFFLTNLILTRSRVTRLTRSIAEGQAELDLMSEEAKGDVSQVDRLIVRADCRSVRELEARYDHYRELRTQLKGLEEKYAQQEDHLRESEERIPKLFERVRSTLEQVDESPKSEDDVEGAVGRAIAKYQVYRETKRRLADLRNQHQGLLGRRRFLERELTTVREGMPEAEQQLRERMREQGFTAEEEHRDINNALAAFYRFMDIHQKDAGRRSELLRARRALDERLPEEETQLEEYRKSFETLLQQAGFDNLEQARSAADNTLVLRDLEHEKGALEQQCEELLQGHPLDHWRKLAGNKAFTENTDADQYARELQALEKENEEALHQYQALKQEKQGLLAAHRSLKEVEEDMAAMEKRMEVLRNDMAAAAHAIALVEETLNTWRIQYGENIGERAAVLLEILGITAVLQVKLDPNDVPAIEVLIDSNKDVSPALVNMTLRLAAVDLLTNENAPRPLVVDMVLQDIPLSVPAEKIIDLFSECAKKRQVLLLFDSEALATAAAKKQLPMLKF
jgi:hypothetical protein